MGLSEWTFKGIMSSSCPCPSRRPGRQVGIQKRVKADRSEGGGPGAADHGQRRNGEAAAPMPPLGSHKGHASVHSPQGGWVLGMEGGAMS